MSYHQDYSKNNTMGATSGTGPDYPSGAPKFTPEF